MCVTVVVLLVITLVPVPVVGEVWSTTFDRMSAKRQPGVVRIDWGRCIQILGFVAGLFGLAVVGAWAILDSKDLDLCFPCGGIVEELLSLAGLLALGSIVAFGTAFLSTMQRVPYDKGRRWWKRFFLCISRTSRLELSVRVSIGASAGSGAYLFTQLTAG